MVYRIGGTKHCLRDIIISVRPAADLTSQSKKIFSVCIYPIKCYITVMAFWLCYFFYKCAHLDVIIAY